MSHEIDAFQMRACCVHAARVCAMSNAYMLSMGASGTTPHNGVRLGRNVVVQMVVKMAWSSACVLMSGI